VHVPDRFAFRNSYAAQKEMAELAFSLLTLRADTPPGSWVDDHDGDSYRAVREKARALAGTAADEDLFLSVLNLGDALLRLLVAATGMEPEVWLARLHQDYIAPIDPEGTGVWDARELSV
jgi:hypothetical protein